MSLCWKCRENLTWAEKSSFCEGKTWWHCHHVEPENKPKCWCEKYHYEPNFANDLRVGNHPIRYCIECGKKLEDI